MCTQWTEALDVGRRSVQEPRLCHSRARLKFAACTLSSVQRQKCDMKLKVRDGFGPLVYFTHQAGEKK